MSKNTDSHDDRNDMMGYGPDILGGQKNAPMHPIYKLAFMTGMAIAPFAHPMINSAFHFNMETMKIINSATKLKNSIC